MSKEPLDRRTPDEPTGDERRSAQPDPSRLQRFGPIAVILTVATALRVFRLARPSYWYDEVVTMQLARQANPLALLRILPWIDASEAPLQPLLLQAWVTLFGQSDLAGRAFSATCGVLTVATVYWIGRRLFDEASGLWGAWLCALSPSLIRYSREVRMYAWLVLLTCLCWAILVSFRDSRSRPRIVAFALCQAGLFYSHPLGAFMIAALSGCYLLLRPAFQLGWRAWLMIQVAIGLAIIPWMPHYMQPYWLPHYPLRFLLGMPIEYIGGNRWALLGCGLLIAWGLIRAGRDPIRSAPSGRKGLARFEGWLDHPFGSTLLLTWFAAPPLLIYGYSWISSQSVFGPARYTLFVAPAYLLLVARGLRKLPLPLRLVAASILAALSIASLLSTIYVPDLRPDWRAAAGFLRREHPRATVVVLESMPASIRGRTINVDAEAARRYFDPGIVVIETPAELDRFLRAPRGREADLWVSISMHDSKLMAEIPNALEDAYRTTHVEVFPSLRLYQMVPRPLPDEARRP